MPKIFFAILLFASVTQAEITGGGYGRNQVRSRKAPAKIQVQTRKLTPVVRQTKPPKITVQVRSNYNQVVKSGSRAEIIRRGGGQAAKQICGGPIEITNRQGQCREIAYDKDLLNLFQNQGLACAKMATQKAFGFTPTKLKFRTGEGQIDWNRFSSNGRRSTHAIGRALDIFDIDVYKGSAFNTFSMDKKDVLKTYNGRTFYSEFGSCWKRAVAGQKGRTAGNCGSGCLDYNTAGHGDHMHISLPPRDKNRANHNVNCT